MREHAENRRGFATMAAIMMMPIVAATVLALTYQFQSQSRHTQAVRSAAQLHQLLRAGSVHALQKLRAPGADPALLFAQPIELPLPAALAGAKVVLVARETDGIWLLEITASRGSDQRRQQLRIERVIETFHVTQTTMLPGG